MSDNDKPCLRCVLKHLLKSKTYLMESVQFGFKGNFNINDLDKIILKLVNYILKMSGKSNISI